MILGVATSVFNIIKADYNSEELDRFGMRRYSATNGGLNFWCGFTSRIARLTTGLLSFPRALVPGVALAFLVGFALCFVDNFLNSAL